MYNITPYFFKIIYINQTIGVGITNGKGIPAVCLCAVEGVGGGGGGEGHTMV